MVSWITSMREKIGTVPKVTYAAGRGNVPSHWWGFAVGAVEADRPSGAHVRDRTHGVGLERWGTHVEVHVARDAGYLGRELAPDGLKQVEHDRPFAFGPSGGRVAVGYTRESQQRGDQRCRVFGLLVDDHVGRPFATQAQKFWVIGGTKKVVNT